MQRSKHIQINVKKNRDGKLHAIHTFSKSAFHRRSERHLAVATATACNTAWRPHRDLFAVAGVIQRAKQFHSVDDEFRH